MTRRSGRTPTGPSRSGDPRRGDAVTLAETIFYALSGGCGKHWGTIGGHVRGPQGGAGDRLRPGPVQPCARRPGFDVHRPGRRHRLMRLHFAAELVLELVYRRFPGVEKTAPTSPRTRRASTSRSTGRLRPTWPISAQAGHRRRRPADQASDLANERRYWKILDLGLHALRRHAPQVDRRGRGHRAQAQERRQGQGKVEITLVGDGTVVVRVE